ncbi:MAG: hypothetical protein IPJ41_18560 [Phycisphaerales bacterium]|nr:hypothetical protein [Phycisphaerales bacterium]
MTRSPPTPARAPRGPGPTILPCAAPPTERLLRALAPFGLGARHEPQAQPTPDPRHLALLRDLPRGHLALVTGPSGSGKSTLLRAATTPPPRGRAIEPARLLAEAPAHTPIVELLQGSLDAALRVLGAAGLSEAPLWARLPGQLSEGQRARLALALAMSQAAREPSPWLALDEFAATLDRETARSLGSTLRRWLDSSRQARVIVATAHDDLAPWLAPDLVIELQTPSRDGAAGVQP